MSLPTPYILPLADARDETLRILGAGGVVFLPTDTLYGFSCGWSDAAARARIQALKGQARSAPFLTLAADRSMVESIAEWPTGEGARVLDVIWPGPVTAVLIARDGGTVGVRVPVLDWLRAWISALGRPIVSTSANRTGAPPSASVAQAVAEFGPSVDLYVDDGPREGVASALLDLTDGVRLLRGEMPPGIPPGLSPGVA